MILRDYRDNVLIKDIAVRYGITLTGVSRIAKRHGLSRKTRFSKDGSLPGLTPEERKDYKNLRDNVGLAEARTWRAERLAGRPMVFPE